MAYGKGGSPGTPTPDWDKDWPPKAPQKPKPKPKLAKKNKNKKGDPEAEYSRPLPGAPAGHNLTAKQIWREGDTSDRVV